MNYYCKTNDGRYLASATDLLWGLTADRRIATTFATGREAIDSFMKLPAAERSGVTCSAVLVSEDTYITPVERDAAKVFLTCSTEVDILTKQLSDNLARMMDAYVTMAKRITAENETLRTENAGLRRQLARLRD